MYIFEDNYNKIRYREPKIIPLEFNIGTTVSSNYFTNGDIFNDSLPFAIDKGIYILQINRIEVEHIVSKDSDIFESGDYLELSIPYEIGEGTPNGTGVTNLHLRSITSTNEDGTRSYILSDETIFRYFIANHSKGTIYFWLYLYTDKGSGIDHGTLKDIDIKLYKIG